jgi:hypothetical protein
MFISRSHRYVPTRSDMHAGPNWCTIPRKPRCRSALGTAQLVGLLTTSFVTCTSTSTARVLIDRSLEKFVFELVRRP